MPLYMDFHKFPRITIEEAKNAHVADERIQKKYGVKYHQFWVNEEAGTVFCLVEGPDKLTCEAVHQTAHGHIACAMVEVDPGYYELIMGANNRIDQNGLVHHENGSVDLGYRNILAVTLYGKPSTTASRNYEHLKTPLKARAVVLEKISKFNGRPIKITGEDSVVGVFNSAMQAVRCAKEIQTILQKKKALGKEGAVSFRMGLSAGQPVTENNEFIEETVRLARRLSRIAGEKKILISSLVRELCGEEVMNPQRSSMKSLNANEEAFITNLFRIIEDKLSDENFNIEDLGRELGISRSQLYRKIKGLTGKAPNDLIRDLRMDRALSHLKQKSGNISEIALEVGFSNPSYFAKCFTRKFGCPPSKFMEIAAPF